MPKPKEFTIGVYRPGPNRLIREAEIDLPASATELLDLFQRARINNERDIYEVELLHCKREFLWEPLENQTLGVHDLNYLAWRLAGLERYEEDIFEGLYKIVPGPSITDLINMTYSLQDCVAMWDVRDDTTLGKQSFEDDFFPELVDISDDAAKFLDYAALGKTRREAEHGIFTANGYVVNINWPNLCDHHKSDDIEPQMLPNTGLKVLFSRVPVSEKAYAPKNAYGFAEGEASVEVCLPVWDDKVAKIERLLGCKINETRVEPLECFVPAMMPHIKPDEALADLNGFALCAKSLHEMGALPLYKAILAATKCDSVPEANICAAEIGQYRLEPEVSTPEEYGREFLMEKLGAEHISAFDRTALWSLGTKLMREQNIRETDYGLLCRKDGGPILTMAERNIEPVQVNGTGFCMTEDDPGIEQTDVPTFEQSV